MNSAETPPSPLTMTTLASAASQKLEAFRQRIRGVPYERKGILFSEMFFFYLCAGAARTARILESGRARAQSTLLLAVSFPDVSIISLEHDPHSPDVPVAAARLQPFRNVDLRFGDATRVLPAIAQRGDVALIDGPKGFRGVRLALRLLAQGRVGMVFLHDVSPGTPERRFLEAWLPDTLYSDDPRFAEVAHALDADADDLPAAHRWHSGGPVRGYGYSLACLQRSPTAAYRRASVAAIFARLTSRGNE